MATAGAKVTIASKLPMGLELQGCKAREMRRRHQGTEWTETEHYKDGPIVRVNGTAYPVGQPPEGFRERPRMVAGFALTPGVDKDFWDAWLAQNRTFPAVANGLLFAFEKDESIQKKARDRQALTSGFDPIDPKGSDPRMPRPIKGITLEGSPGPTDLDAVA